MKNKQLKHHQYRPMDKQHTICFLAHNIISATNIGSLFRIADALGVDKILLSGESPAPPNRKIKKVSRSTDNYVAYECISNVMEQISLLKSEGYLIISLEITSSSQDIRDFSITIDDKICLVLGSENTGVSSELLDVSDKTIHIPMFGINSSMNIATATSIATFEIIKQLKTV